MPNKDDEIIEIPEGTMVDLDGKVLDSLETRNKPAKDPGPPEPKKPKQEAKQPPPKSVKPPPPEEEDEEPVETMMMEAPEKTVIMDSARLPGARQQEIPPAKLICLFGNDKGRDFAITQKTTLVGRGLDCDVIVNDPSVSRKHFNIIYGPKGFKLIDLGSGNGTKVHGQRVREADLEDGEKIEMGTTMLQFVMDAAKTRILDEATIAAYSASLQKEQKMPAASKPQVPKPQAPKPLQTRGEKISQTFDAGEMVGQRKIAPVVFVIIGILLVAGIGYGVYYFVSSKKSEESPQTETAKQDEKARKKADAEEFYNKGMTFFKDRKWDEAIAEFKKAEDLFYDLDGLDEASKKAEKEKKAEESFKAGRANFEKNAFADAEKDFKNIPESSVYYVEMQEFLNKIKTSQFEERVKKARELFEAKKIKEVREEVQKLYDENPENQAVLELKKELEKTGAAFEIKKPAEKKETVSEKKETTVAYVKTTDFETETPKPKGGYQDAINYYKAGNFGRASALLKELANKTKNKKEKESYIQMAGTIEDFSSTYIKGKQSAKQYMYGKAVPDLMKALSLDKAINGYYQTELRTLLGEMYSYQAAKSFADKKYDEAASLARKALALIPNDDTAKNIEAKVSEKAKSLFEEAKAKNDREGAKNLLRQVVKIVPPSDPLYREAYKMLNELAGE
jgi:pSer/pThr/pTyr-binding forkhead associated (FHA) protein